MVLRHYYHCVHCGKKLAGVTSSRYVRIVQRTCRHCRSIWEIVDGERGGQIVYKGKREDKHGKSE